MVVVGNSTRAKLDVHIYDNSLCTGVLALQAVLQTNVPSSSGAPFLDIGFFSLDGRPDVLLQWVDGSGVVHLASVLNTGNGYDVSETGLTGFSTSAAMASGTRRLASVVPGNSTDCIHVLEATPGMIMLCLKFTPTQCGLG